MVDKVIINPKLARKLLHLGYQVIDIKANKYDNSKTVFIFRVDNLGEFKNTISKIGA